jgi:hypothetical protein
MILPLVALLVPLAQAPAAAAPPDAKPVRVWLDRNGPLTRGAAVRVYVQAARDGNLVVLHRGTDGHIAVLFPTHPSDDPLVHTGTYEIRGPGDRAAFIVSEPDGTGMILAALSPDPVRFDEFARLAAWDPDALVGSWRGADPEGSMSDIVQRMLGDGYFNYDLVTYTVVPASYAQQDTLPQSVRYASCIGCTFIEFDLFAAVPVSRCDVALAPCLGLGRFHRDRVPCAKFSPCGEAPTSALALNLRSATPRAVAALPQRSRFVMPNRGSSQAIGVRRRAPDPGAAHGLSGAGGVVLLVPRPRSGSGEPGTPVARRPRRALQDAGPVPASAPALTALGAPRTHVRVTRLSIPTSEEPRSARAVSGGGALPLAPSSERGIGQPSAGTLALALRPAPDVRWGRMAPPAGSRAATSIPSSELETQAWRGGVALPGATRLAGPGAAPLGGHAPGVGAPSVVGPRVRSGGRASAQRR